MLEFCVVLAKRQNRFFVELASALVDELEQAGHPASISTDGFPPPREDLVYVLLPPHEYFALEGDDLQPTSQVLGRTVAICCEQPDTAFFARDVDLARRTGAVLDINQYGVSELRRNGLRHAEHLQLGWTRSWSHATFTPEGQEAGGADRDVDVLHLGIVSEHRAKVLAGAAPHLARWRTEIRLASDQGTHVGESIGFTADAAKWALLRRCRTLLNVHVADRPYFEWLRVVQAICNGVAVVSEHGRAYQPLVAGEHFLSGRGEVLGLLVQPLLEDEDARRALAARAWLHLRDELPMARGVQTLIEEGLRVAEHPLPPRGRTFRFPHSRAPAARIPPAVAPPSDVVDLDGSVLRAAVKDLRLEMLSLRRELAVARRPADAPQGTRVVARTPAYAPARPDVTVLTALYDYEQTIGAALTSAAASDIGTERLECVIVDDGSNDGSQPAARRWMDEHPDVPAILLAHPHNRGLGPARNTALDLARAPFCFVLDADNEVYPQAIGRLLDALGREPGATFSYGMLAMVDRDMPVGLRSAAPWHRDGLRSGNYIDAMALVRTTWLRGSGGYTTLKGLHGWEDYDLWCRVAEQGGHGVLVPSIIARYGVTGHSMLSLTNISSRQAVSLLIERHPTLMRGVVPPL